MPSFPLGLHKCPGVEAPRQYLFFFPPIETEEEKPSLPFIILGPLEEEGPSGPLPLGQGRPLQGRGRGGRRKILPVSQAVRKAASFFCPDRLMPGR